MQRDAKNTFFLFYYNNRPNTQTQGLGLFTIGGKNTWCNIDCAVPKGSKRHFLPFSLSYGL